MPDLVAFSWRRRYDRAVAKLREYLANRLGVTQEQDAKALQLYQTRRVTAGWRLKITFPDQIRRLDLLLDEGFPYAPPLVAVVERPPPLTWPHIEDDGVLCLLPSSA